MTRTWMKTSGVVAAVLAITAAAGVACTGTADPPAAVPPPASAPPPAATYQVEPFWPKELPNNWMFGNVIGVDVDSNDNVWVMHRPRSQPGAEDTPPVLGFDAEGTLISSWGGQATIPEWGTQEHGLYIDPQDNIWVGFGGGNPYEPPQPHDTPEWMRHGWYGNAHVLKLTTQGNVILGIGRFGKTAGSDSREFLGGPTDIAVDPDSNEAFITDGYINRRVFVADATDGTYKRHWGAYRNTPVDSPPTFMSSRTADGPQPQQFNIPHCIAATHDGLLYVCDRGNTRIQIFERDGTFVRDLFVKDQDDPGPGEAPQDIAISPDPQQRLMHVLTGERVYTLERDTLTVVGSFGHRGRSAGQFISAHSLAIDSKGNLFVGETLAGSRIQKFVPTP